MKKLLLFSLAALALVSCKKTGNESSPFTAPATGENYPALNIKTSAQVVKMTVSGNVLNMVYNEDVTLILDSNTLAKSLEVHLKEGFDGTSLANYDYHSLTKFGVNATNWVDDNLKNIVIHSSKDTLINSHLFVKKRITRVFNYQRAYANPSDAAMTMGRLLKQTDILTFSAYYAPENPDVATTVNTAKLTYAKM